MKKYVKVLKIKDIKKREDNENLWDITLILEGENGNVEHKGVFTDPNDIFLLKEQYIGV